jgi:hypothetical protein
MSPSKPLPNRATLNVRGIDPDAVLRLKMMASARGWTVGLAIERLVDLAVHLQNLSLGNPDSAEAQTYAKALREHELGPVVR